MNDWMGVGPLLVDSASCTRVLPPPSHSAFLNLPLLLLLQELGDVRQETVVLARTESILKGRAGDVDEFLRRQEEKVRAELRAVITLNYC